MSTKSFYLQILELRTYENYIYTFILNNDVYCNVYYRKFNQTYFKSFHLVIERQIKKNRSSILNKSFNLTQINLLGNCWIP